MGKRIDSLSIKYTEGDIIDFMCWYLEENDDTIKQSIKILLDLYLQSKKESDAKVQNITE